MLYQAVIKYSVLYKNKTYKYEQKQSSEDQIRFIGLPQGDF